ncbi:signal recognition particle protein [bacterium]|nr:signal recognition particle protein [bacterium]
MFGGLSEKFQDIFSGFSKGKTFTEENIKEAVRQVRLALLDADVNYKVASALVKKIKEKVVGTEVEKKLKTSDAFIEIVHEELKLLMGAEEAKINFKKKPLKVLLCGLQGSGKTTTCAKLANMAKEEEKKSVSLVALDLKRPAAVKQLQVLGEQVGAPVFAMEGESDPIKVAKAAMGLEDEVLIFDTAGRQNLDEELMEELLSIKEVVNPDYILFVANCGSGQQAVNVAKAFDEKMDISGSILTMLDGSARAGAAISIREVTGKPLFYEGVGEKITDFQVFHPKSMADRILGMGDVVNLVKKMKKEISEEDSKKMEQKVLKGTFTYDDFLKQMKMLKKMGSLKGIFNMLPGMGKGASSMDFAEGENQLKTFEAIIHSMTKKERAGMDDLTMGRKKRIAKGAGISLGIVNKLVKKFKQMREMAKHLPKIQKNFSRDQQKIKKNPDFNRFFS